MRNQAWAFLHVADEEPTNFGCVGCGAYRPVWFCWVKKPCRLACAAQRLTQKYVIEEKEPVHPHRPFFTTRFITLGEAAWLHGK